MVRERILPSCTGIYPVSLVRPAPEMLDLELGATISITRSAFLSCQNGCTAPCITRLAQPRWRRPCTPSTRPMVLLQAHPTAPVQGSFPQRIGVDFTHHVCSHKPPLDRIHPSACYRGVARIYSPMDPVCCTIYRHAQDVSPAACSSVGRRQPVATPIRY